MLQLDKTTERLRSKHVRTLELLQKTLDENVELRDRLAQLQKGTLHLSQGVPRSNRTNELEDEIDRLKAEHCAAMVAIEEAAKIREKELMQALETQRTQQQRLQNDVSTLETRLSNIRENVQDERLQWQLERQRLTQENETLKDELRHISEGRETNYDRYQAEISALHSQLDASCCAHNEAEALNRHMQDELDLLHTEISHLKQVVVENQAQLSAAQAELVATRVNEAKLISEMASSRRRIDEPQDNLGQQQPLPALNPVRIQTPRQLQLQQQLTTALLRLQEIEEQNSRLVNENRSLQETLTKLQLQLQELTAGLRAQTANGSMFAAHIDLKRENVQLRAQIEELKQLQRRFLTTANKKTISFPAL
ncbi:hypothetical protein Poli38472_010513 [Pythium oligandrum]|uniref:Uncharacterized protein n=1 Tax=Pythium oligandrum TaxID=41045 RepID=A0A8K1C381_PYTOL|nr:hypothetical protein Poli38472_010513 [Pythium oligandrum]|eukprot:TMW55631.1 hypothetical protein Poli38472_010513 [Pythium oligandrum]